MEDDSTGERPGHCLVELNSYGHALEEGVGAEGELGEVGFEDQSAPHLHLVVFQHFLHRDLALAAVYYFASAVAIVHVDFQPQNQQEGNYGNKTPHWQGVRMPMAVSVARAVLMGVLGLVEVGGDGVVGLGDDVEERDAEKEAGGEAVKDVDYFLVGGDGTVEIGEHGKDEDLHCEKQPNHQFHHPLKFRICKPFSD